MLSYRCYIRRILPPQLGRATYHSAPAQGIATSDCTRLRDANVFAHWHACGVCRVGEPCPLGWRCGSSLLYVQRASTGGLEVATGVTRHHHCVRAIRWLYVAGPCRPPAATQLRGLSISGVLGGSPITASSHPLTPSLEAPASLPIAANRRQVGDDILPASSVWVTHRVLPTDISRNVAYPCPALRPRVR